MAELKRGILTKQGAGMSVSEWSSMVEQMASQAPKPKSKHDQSRDRVICLLKRKKLIAVADVVRDLGMSDMTARRVLAEITPTSAREVPGRPVRWRAV